MVCLEPHQPVVYFLKRARNSLNFDFDFLVLWLQGSRNQREAAVALLTLGAMTICRCKLSLFFLFLLVLYWFFLNSHTLEAFLSIVLASRWISCIDFRLCLCFGCRGYKGHLIQGLSLKDSTAASADPLKWPSALAGILIPPTMSWICPKDCCLVLQIFTSERAGLLPKMQTSCSELQLNSCISRICFL